MEEIRTWKSHQHAWRNWAKARLADLKASPSTWISHVVHESIYLCEIERQGAEQSSSPANSASLVDNISENMDFAPK